MSYIKDEVLFSRLAIPGAHNAGSCGMSPMACCQSGGLYEQFCHGVRYFCIRLNTKKNRIVMSHGISAGEDFELSLADMKKMLDENDSEFFIFDIREYYNQKFGPLTLRYKAEPSVLDELLEKYIEPSKFALCDFEDITKLTMGDLRSSGKRYLLHSYNQSYKYSVNCKNIFPWEKMLYGSHAKDFAADAHTMFRQWQEDALFWYQTQQTPNLGTAVGVSTPKQLDTELRVHYRSLISKIAEDRSLLDKVNVVAGDFMSLDYLKSREILRLNLLKDAVQGDLIAEYSKGLIED